MTVLLLQSGGVVLGVSCALMAIAIGAATVWMGLQLGRQLTMPAVAPKVIGIQDAQKKVKAGFTLASVSRGEVELALDNLLAVVFDVKFTVLEMVETSTANSKFIRAKLCFDSLSLSAGALVSSMSCLLVPYHVQVTRDTSLLTLRGFRAVPARLETQEPSDPLMTMLCNLAASALSAVFMYALDEGCGDTPEDTHWKSILGISMGFCGSLSTSNFLSQSTHLIDTGKLEEKVAVSR